MRLSRKRCSTSIIVLLATGVVSGCTSQSLPTAPAATQNQTPAPVVPETPSVSGMIIEPSGACVANATVEVIAGQAVGDKAVQKGLCSHWDPYDGFVFKNLTPGIPLTLRISAEGYVTTIVTLPPTLTPWIVLEWLPRP